MPLGGAAQVLASLFLTKQRIGYAVILLLMVVLDWLCCLYQPIHHRRRLLPNKNLPYIWLTPALRNGGVVETFELCLG